MRLRETQNSDLLEKDYDAYVHDLVQTCYQQYVNKHGKRPSVIYLNHYDALALARHSFKLVNKTMDILCLEEMTFCGTPIVFREKENLFD